jgi:hypothetical protein
MYGSNSLTSKQAELHAQRHARAKRRRIFFTVIFFVLVVSFFYVIRQPFLRVNSITISGNTLVDINEVKSFTENKILGYRYLLIPRNSILFLHRDDLESQVLNKFPRLSKVTIVGARDLNMTVYEPVYTKMYCNLVGEEKDTPQNCALLHTDGKLGSLAAKYSYSPFFTFYKAEDALPELGKNVLNEAELNRVSLIQNEVESYNIPVIGFVYGTDYDEVLLNTGSSFDTLPRIRILPGATSVDISKTLGIAARDAVVKKLLVENIRDLDYVDLRFSGQVVYKKHSEQ